MAAPSDAFWDQEGHFHTNALHWEGFPRLLWESLQIFGYDTPPLYDGYEFDEAGVPRCRVMMTIPQHPSRHLWQPVTISKIGHRLVDTFESAALEAIHIFCDKHPEEVAAYPIGLFPAAESRDPEWTFRISSCSHLLGDLSLETLQALIRFMNVQHHYQLLQRRSMNQLSALAQAHHGTITQQLDELDELHNTMSAQADLMAQRDVIINNQENQIHERETVIGQRDTIIEFLQDQVQELTIELDDAVNHINNLHEQPAPFVVPDENGNEEEEDPEEIEGVSELDSEHGDPVLSPHHSSSGSQSSVGNFDDF
ncbi:hypothetical protein GQ55_4G240200 [Panicum hallii var. hallii]|uniref:Uncharacterized protein n=1 Tax=Panicum hallii var. hallii TaxID=1504633 RepID=A0A2T7DZP8_9POAL|nr:hypothetical protein GQ55_4G240200 [Panicum hallii var. hallii]